MSSPTGHAAEKSYFHHFIPQFILRKYSDYVDPHPETLVRDKAIEKARKKAKNRANVKILDLRDGYEKAQLRRCKASKIMGVPDMYQDADPACIDVNEIEKKLSDLEQQASKILRQIETDFLQGKAASQLVRSDKDTLRRFFSIMLFRNRTIHGKYEKSTDDYNADDREMVLQYMQKEGFTTPKAVWLANIRAFLDVRLDHDDARWSAELLRRALPLDAAWFIDKMTGTFLSFCTPQESSDEFILTQNAYSIFEGPNTSQGWTDWHTFAPINHKLLVIMRRNVLQSIFVSDGNSEQLVEKWEKQRHATIEKLAAVFEDRSDTQSLLQDLPIYRPQISYGARTGVEDGQITNRITTGLRDDDTFLFKFYPLSTNHVQRINSFFLEEALDTQAIVYKSDTGLRRALEAYLETNSTYYKLVKSIPGEGGFRNIMKIPRNGRSVIQFGYPFEYRHERYLQTLERLAKQIGSQIEARYSVTVPKALGLSPRWPSEFSKRYRMLGRLIHICVVCMPNQIAL